MLMVPVVALLGAAGWAASDVGEPPAESPPAEATTVAQDPQSTAAPGDVASTSPEPTPRKKSARRADRDKLPKPEGVCADSDVVVRPTVVRAERYRAVLIRLEVTTLESPACHWQVSPDSVALTVTRGAVTVWSSRHCPEAVPSEVVVARQEKPGTVLMRWNGRESDEDCSPATDYLGPGRYTLLAAARGSTVPTVAVFRLEPTQRERPPEGSAKAADPQT